ncbi:MAG TPA: ATP-binding protein [Steroidobacteraceae bacterium]|nr:ATP-binding protein [Steroidobacteraceae bacterium]
MRRLHIQFYLAILAALVVFVLAAGLLWSLPGERFNERWGTDAAAQLAAVLLAPASEPADRQQAALDDLRTRLRLNLALYDRDGSLIAATEGGPRLSQRRLERSGWRLGNRGPVWVLPLHDGRRLAVQHPYAETRGGPHVLIVPVAIVLAFVLGAYPIARRLTRRLARLQRGVEQLGQGDLATRVAVEGRDEVAALARSFNQSAERIEELVRAHKMLLANCSHELRTPLARIRLGIERLASGPDTATLAELGRSIAELNALIEETLLASRLNALGALERTEDVDLLALAAEEAAHFDRTVEGEPVTVRGDPSLLRRMIRNLLENAGRHGGGATRVHVGAGAGGMAEIIIEDRGPGVAQSERERIFEPFYRAAGAGGTERGFGLGLAIVRQIARAHAGDVAYTALEAGGSRFTVRVARR